MGTTVRELMLRIQSEASKVETSTTTVAGKEGTNADEVEEVVEEEDENDEDGEARGESTRSRKRRRRCRICACEASEVVCIFGDEGRSRDLQGCIRKYLHITVSSEDNLPKMVCASCIGRLESIHDFATMALRSQEKLRQELMLSLEQKSPTENSAAVVDDSPESSNSCANKLEDRGLLHSILTKGSIDTSNDCESLRGRQRTPSTEEMEVKVDPMLFLQCTFEQASSVDYSDYSDDSEREVSSYSEPLLMTNKARVKKEPRPVTEDASVLSKSRDSNDNDNCEEDLAEFEDEDEEEDDAAAAKVLKPYVCKVCAKPFASQLTLQNHLWSHLPTNASMTTTTSDKQQRDYTSNGCSENNLLGMTNFICPICGKKISTKGNLKVHLETHRPKGKYGCDICGRIFKTQSNLYRHKEYHSNVQFPCLVCGRVYPTNSTLRAHSITHSDLRPHACPLCDKTFKRNQDLKFHINQHTGARPYQCPYCPKAFASSGNCFSHRKRMHPKEVNRDRQRAADLMR